MEPCTEAAKGDTQVDKRGTALEPIVCLGSGIGAERGHKGSRTTRDWRLSEMADGAARGQTAARLKGDLGRLCEGKVAGHGQPGNKPFSGWSVGSGRAESHQWNRKRSTQEAKEGGSTGTGSGGRGKGGGGRVARPRLRFLSTRRGAVHRPVYPGSAAS